MDKRWMEAATVGLMLVWGCGDESLRMPGDDPGVNDAAAGASGESLGGNGGGGGEGGSSVHEALTEECDPGKPDAMPTDTDMRDAGAMVADADAGSVAIPEMNDADAGIDFADAAIGVTEDASATFPDAPRAPASHGEVVISEVMLDPTALTDATGEWIELHNTTTVDLELNDCLVTDDRTDDFRLSALVFPAGGYLVLGRTAEAASHVDHVYSGMVLANTSDEIVVTCGDVMIDRVAYESGFPRPAGKSMQLRPDLLNAVDNDQSSSWCASADAGTPGSANPACQDN